MATRDDRRGTDPAEERRRWGYDPAEDRRARGVAQDERQFGDDRGWGGYGGDRRGDADVDDRSLARDPSRDWVDGRGRPGSRGAGRARPAGADATRAPAGARHATDRSDSGRDTDRYDSGRHDTDRYDSGGPADDAPRSYAAGFEPGRQGGWLGGRSVYGPGDWGGRDGLADRGERATGGAATGAPGRTAHDRRPEPDPRRAAESGGGGDWAASGAGWSQRRGAESRGGAPFGHAGPAAGTGPRGWRRTDERIHDDVCDRLARRRDLDVADVSVEVEDGWVRLSGTVSDRPMKHAIERVVDACAGVRDIDNRIRVMRPDVGGADEPPAPHASVPTDSPTARDEARGLIVRPLPGASGKAG